MEPARDGQELDTYASLTAAFQKARRRWAWIFVLLVFLAYFVPYAVLSKVTKFYGAFLFWCLYALVAIGCMAAITGKWRD